MKYQVGAFNLRGAPTHDVRAAGRLTVNVFDPEPGYYNQSTYFGERRILALGVAGQYQRRLFPYEVGIPDGTPDRYADMKSFNVDLLFERPLGRGVVTLEGAYYNFTDTFPKFEAGGTIVTNVLIPTTFSDRRQQSYFGLASYLFPAWGPGRPQILARYQGSPDHVVPNGKNEIGSSMYTIDAFLSYVLAGHRARLFAGYQFIYINTTNTPMWVQFGLQGQL